MTRKSISAGIGPQNNLGQVYAWHNSLSSSYFRSVITSLAVLRRHQDVTGEQSLWAVM